jgi:hypothetical protein
LQVVVDEPAQLSQLIGAEEGAAGADRNYKVRLQNVGPLDGQRAQPPVGTGIRDAVAAPVVAHGEQIEGLSSQRMEGMGDGENLCAMLVTICNARLTPKPP